MSGKGFFSSESTYCVKAIFLHNNLCLKLLNSLSNAKMDKLSNREVYILSDHGFYLDNAI